MMERYQLPRLPLTSEGAQEQTLWLCDVDFGGSGVYGLHATREAAIEAGKTDAIPGAFVFIAPVRLCDEDDPECWSYDYERESHFAVIGGATSWREREGAVSDE